MRSKIHRNPDFHRIKGLPYRGPDLLPLTELRTKTGTQSLRPVQVQALSEMMQVGGAFLPMRVGAGKTLVSLLASTVLQAKRPLLLLPANLIAKTERERRILSKDWQVPSFLKLYSYEMLSRVSGANLLEFQRPDLIICDEVHNLKNLSAACTRRVARYLDKYPETKFVGMSGTVIKNSLKDFAHLLYWSLKDKAPIPLDPQVLNSWCMALDQGVNEWQRPDPGALLEFCEVSDRFLEPVQAARAGFSRRLMGTVGVVGSMGSDEDYQGSLKVTGHLYAVNQATETNFKRLREAWVLPDGWEISEPLELWRHARELALGLHYVRLDQDKFTRWGGATRWENEAERQSFIPSARPPEAWLQARSAWAKFVREIISSSNVLDSELQVKEACRRGELDSRLLLAYERAQHLFTPLSLPVWHDEAALAFAEEWSKKGPGLIWVQHTFFAQALAKRTGMQYYREGGLNETGQPIESASGCVIVSVEANKEGRNLQHWNRNLLTSLSGGAAVFEQLVGRTHRGGQKADTVTVDLMVGCKEDLNDWTKAVEEAKAIEGLLGQNQKILLADVDMPDKGTGARWL